MTQAPHHYAAPLPPPPRDRRTGLIVFGILALVIGGLSSCSAIFTPLMLLMAAAMPRQPGVPPPDTRAIASAVIVYAVIATAFIAGGIASVRTRRWARPLMLSVAWTWLLIGVFGMILWIAIAPSMGSAMMAGQGTGASPPPPELARIIVWFGSAIVFVLYLVLPVVFILFYRSPHVRATLEHYDPTPGWADRAPVPVFGLAVALVVSGLFTASMATYAVFPLFHRMLIGPSAVVAMLSLAALFVIAGLLVFRLRMSGWWLTLAISIVLPLSLIVSMRTLGVIEMYGHMMPPEQVAPLRDNMLIQGPLLPIATAVLGVAGVIYLAAVRKSFVGSPEPGERRNVASAS